MQQDDTFATEVFHHWGMHDASEQWLGNHVFTLGAQCAGGKKSRSG